MAPKALAVLPFFALLYVLPAQARVTFKSCGNARVDAYVADMYGPLTGKKGAGAPAYGDLGTDSQEQMCYQVEEALKRYDAVLPELQAESKWLTDDSAARFCSKLYDLLPVVQFNIGSLSGYEAVLPPQPGEALDKQAPRLARIVQQFKAFDRASERRPGLEALWPPVEAKLMKQAQAASARGQGPADAQAAAKAAQHVDLSNFKTNKVMSSASMARSADAGQVFDNAQAKGALTSSPGQGRAAKAGPGFPRGEPSLPSIQPSAATMERLRKLGAVKKTEAGLGKADYTKAAYDLIVRRGTAEAGLDLVMEARGGDYNEVPFAKRVAAVKAIEEATGLKLKDPRVDSSVDYDLMHMDHFLNAHAGTQGEVFRPEADDWWITRKGKTFVRVFRSVGGTVITALYEGSKLADQNLGTPTGKIKGYDFKDPMCSQASFRGLGAGLKGIWMGVFDEGVEK